MDFFDTLNRLCCLAGPSGFEGTVAQTANELLNPFMDEVSVDTLGSVIGVRHCGRPNAKKILLDAHLDEIGLIVTGIEEGFLRFATIGGVDPRMLPARELIVMTKPEPIFGVVACVPSHTQSKEDQEKSVAIEDLRVDIGMTQEEAKKAVPIGTPMVYREGCFRLAGDQITGKALDDRSCFAVLLRTAELLKDADLDVDLYIMGSVQEERGGSGAKVGTYSTMPDFCVAVDVTFASTPGIAEDQVACKLHGGPAIGIGPNMTRWMTERMTEKAKAADIPYQTEVIAGHSGTNGWGMQTCLEGIPTSVLSLPLKYMHSPIEVVAIEDMEHTAQLLAAFVRDLGKEGI